MRDGGGRADAVPGPARPDPTGFATWLDAAIGPPDRGEPVVVRAYLYGGPMPKGLTTNSLNWAVMAESKREHLERELYEVEMELSEDAP